MVTLNEFFAPDAAALAGPIKTALTDDTFCVKAGGLEKLAMLGWRMLPDTIAGHVGPLLDVGLDDILVGGWNKSQALRRCLAKSAQSPGKPVLVELAEHKVTSKHEPYLTLFQNGLEVARLKFSVSVELVLQGAVLRMLDGKIAEIQAGQIKGKGRVHCGRALLLEKELQPIAVPGTIRLTRRKIAAENG